MCVTWGNAFDADTLTLISTLINEYILLIDTTQQEDTIDTMYRGVTCFCTVIMYIIALGVYTVYHSIRVNIDAVLCDVIV